MKVFKFFLILFITGSLFLIGCSKSDTTSNDPTTITDSQNQNASDYSTSENLFMESYFMLENEAEKESSIYGFAPDENTQFRTSCPTVTVLPSGNTFPKTITLDYGTGCVNAQGQTVSGKIIAVFSGQPKVAGTNVNVTFQSLKYKSYTLGGTYTVIFTSANGFTAQISNGTILQPNGKSITYQATFNVVQTAGTSTTYKTSGNSGILDDVYSITGSGTGKDGNGLNYTANITSPLIKANSCQWVSSGTATLKVTNELLKTLDFGTGNCDNQATLTIGKLSTTITLP